MYICIYEYSDSDIGGPFSCIKVARWGNDWGTKNRSRVMFIAFWMSFIGMIILIIPFMALSDDPKVVVFSHWMNANLNILFH